MTLKSTDINRNITHYEIPNNITKLDDYCFKDCVNLESIYIPESVIRIEGHCFEKCQKLREIYIPNSVTYIGKNCFEYCLSLKKVVLSDKLHFSSSQLNIPQYFNTDGSYSYKGNGSYKSGCTCKVYVKFEHPIGRNHGFDYFLIPNIIIKEKHNKNKNGDIIY